MQTKDQRLNIRTSQRQNDRLRMAAEAQEQSVSEFVLQSALDRAEMVLADKRWFELSPERFAEFERLLEEPTKFEKLAAIFATESAFGKEFKLAEG